MPLTEQQMSFRVRGQHLAGQKDQQRQPVPSSVFSRPVAILITGFITFSRSKMSFTSLQIAKKASSTPSPVRALTSRNITGEAGVEQRSARATPSSVETTLAAPRSFLLAKMILGTPGGAFSAICVIQALRFWKESRSVREQVRTMPEAPLQQVSVMVRQRSCPAVSQICSFTRLPSISSVRALKSTPIVATQFSLNRSPTNDRIRFVLPTPLSPIIISFARMSTLSFVFIIIYSMRQGKGRGKGKGHKGQKKERQRIKGKGQKVKDKRQRIKGKGQKIPLDICLIEQGIEFLLEVLSINRLMLSSLARRGVRARFGSVEAFSAEELSSAQKYVEETVRSRTWVTYMMASYLPQAVRPAFYAVHLLDMELTKISENAREPSLAQGKLNFWREAVHRIYAGEKPQPEPLCVALHHAVRHHPLTNGYFQRMIGVRGTEVAARSIASVGEMRRMADDSKGTLLALTLELLRIEVGDEHMRAAISYLGQAIGICEYLRRVPYSLRNNRFLLPEDVLAKYNLTVRNIWDRVYGKPSEELFDAALELASYAKRAFEEAVLLFRAHPASFPEHSFRAFLRGVETEYYLENLEKYNFNLFDQNLNNFSPVKLPYRVYNAAKAKQFFTTPPQQ